MLAKVHAGELQCWTDGGLERQSAETLQCWVTSY